MSDEELLEFMEEEGGAAAPKSVILKAFNNWGDGNFIGIRSIEFTLGGIVIPMNATLGAAYATSSLNASYVPLNAFDTSLSKTGDSAGNCWHSLNPNVTNQKLIWVFNTPTLYDGITINDSHKFGANTSRGAKDVEIYNSTDEVTNPVFVDAIPNSVLRWTGAFNEHVASGTPGVEDPQVLTLI